MRTRHSNAGPQKSGNPIFPGFYADPEARIFKNEYWVFPTYSAPYEAQTFLDAFHSPDLVRWTKTEKILDQKGVSWAKKAIWAPSPIEYHGRYYLYFAANDIQNDQELGGIGVAVSDRPEGPYIDCLGKPLIAKFYHQAQPIDPHIFMDTDGSAYLYYGGWRHCNVVKLGPDLVSIETFPDGEQFREITPAGYVEGPCMLQRQGKYYFMWAEGDWMGPDYSVAYAIAASPLGPFKRVGKILEQNPAIATGAGHHGVIHVPGRDEWYVVYHRRPLEEISPHSRVICIDRLYFHEDGTIKPIKITFEGVPAASLSSG